MRIASVASACCLGVLLSFATPAHAQYKNTSFGFDLGGWLITKPSVTENGRLIDNADKRPLRLSNGLRLGGETNFKMLSDNWWFTGRVNIAFLRFPSAAAKDLSVTAKYDREAKDALGTLLGVQAGIGLRYVIFTDNVRPYVQLGLSYLRLMSFTDLASQDCTADVVGCDGESYASTYLPHPNVGAVHLQPGIEWIVARDLAINLFADVERWIIFNADDNHAVVLGLGILFFT
ncbi:MAG: hypothetical protein HY903_14430 [Deltaproteobacteria bacterium]|nr:hypothetical protein [Deltaproteobacteria bacterium]